MQVAVRMETGSISTYRLGGTRLGFSHSLNRFQLVRQRPRPHRQLFLPRFVLGIGIECPNPVLENPVQSIEVCGNPSVLARLVLLLL